MTSEKRKCLNTGRTHFKKGMVPWNKGLTKECDKRVLEYGRKGSQSKKGSIPWNKDKHDYKMPPCSDDKKRKISESLKGDKHFNWQGGLSFEPYGIEFNKKLKEKIRFRDNYRCQECRKHQSELITKTGRPYKLFIHHIDYNKKNNKDTNLVSLCNPCHNKTNFSREDWTIYFIEKLATAD